MTDRAKAQRVADAYELAYRNRQSETQVRRVMADIFADVHGESLCHYTLSKWFETWLERVKPEIDPQTYDSYEDMTVLVKKVDALLAEDAKANGERYTPIAEMLLDRIEAKHLLALRNRMAGIRSSTTTNHKLKILRQCFKAAWVEGIIPDNPAARVKNVKAEQKEEGESRRPFTADELKRLLAIADDEWRGMIFAGLYTAGQRLSDICTLTAGQVDLENMVVKISTDKTGRQVITPITQPWLKDLRPRMKGKAPGERLFPTAYARYKQSGERVVKVSHSFRRMLCRLGLATNPSKRRKGAVDGRHQMNPLSFHSLRHTATSLLKNAGVSDSVVMDIVGHESEAVSRNYTHIDDATKRAALEKLPSIG